MWDYVQLPQAADDPSQREKLIEQYAADKMREYDGTIFLCISRSDRERRLTLCSGRHWSNTPRVLPHWNAAVSGSMTTATAL